jgi:hypothetical protein
MKSSSLYKLAVALVVLSALALIAWLLSRPTAPSTLVPEALALKVDRIDFQGPSGSFTLARSKAGWQAQAPVAYPINDAKAQEILQRLPGLKLSDELSNDASRLEIFGLNDSSATLVRIHGEGAQGAMEFYMGKDGPNVDSVFVRLPGKGAMVAQGLAVHDLRLPLEDWLNNAVCDIPPDHVRRLMVVSKSGRMELRRTGDVWAPAPSGRALSTGTVEALVMPAVGVAARMEADHVVPASQSPSAANMGLLKPEMTVQIADGSDVVLLIGDKDSRGDRYVQRKGESRVIFMVADWKFNPLRSNDFAKIFAGLRTHNK